MNEMNDGPALDSNPQPLSYQVWTFWSAHECEIKAISQYEHCITRNLLFVSGGELKNEDQLITLNDFIVVATGQEGLPRYETGLILFDHKANKLSTANTCAPSLTFANMRQLAGSREKVEEHIMAIVNGTGGIFGKA